MIPSEVWTLIGVIVGALIGFLLNLLRDYIQERKLRKKYLGDLLADLEYNEKLVKEGKKWGYHTLGYIDAKGAKYLFDLPENLRIQIYDVQSLITSGYAKNQGLSCEEIEQLKELLKNIIPEFKRYLNS